jgi:hypothetical protein
LPTSPYAPAFAVASRSQPPAPAPATLQPEPISAGGGDDNWDELCALIDIDAIASQTAEMRHEQEKQEAEAKRLLDETRRREEEERNARQAREKQLLQEKNNMELLARCLHSVVEKVKRAILYDRNTPTIRTSLVRACTSPPPLQ